MPSRFWSSAGAYGVGQHGFWPYPVPKATAPSEYEILTNGTSYTFKSNEPAALTLNASSIGSTSSADGRVATLTYTPSATVYDSRLNGTASGLNAVERRIAVGETNHITQQDVSNAAWGKVSTTVGARSTDANGLSYNRVTCSAGSAQHYVTTPTLSPTATSTTGNTFEFVIKPSGTQVIFLNITQTNAPEVIIDLATGYALKQFCSGGIVETYSDGRIRIQIVSKNSLAGTTMRLYPLATLSAAGSGGTATAAGTEYIDVYSATFIDGPAAHRNDLTYAARPAASSPTGMTRFLTRSPIFTTVANSNQDVNFDIILPSGYNPANTYKMIISCGVEPIPGTTYTYEMALIQAAGLANTYNVIVVQSWFYGGIYPWLGSFSDGSNNHEAIIRDCVIPWMRAHYSIGAGREYVGMMGWSKGAWAALSFILRNPSSVGYIGIWDPDYLELYGAADGHDNGETTAFDSNAQYILYNPKDILASKLASIKDKKRIHLAGSSAWQVDTQQLHTDLNTNSIAHNWDYHDMGSGFHVSSSGWLDGTSTWAADGGSSVFAGLVGLMPA